MAPKCPRSRDLNIAYVVVNKHSPEFALGATQPVCKMASRNRTEPTRSVTIPAPENRGADSSKDPSNEVEVVINTW